MRKPGFGVNEDDDQINQDGKYNSFDYTCNYSYDYEGF